MNFEMGLPSQRSENTLWRGTTITKLLHGNTPTIDIHWQHPELQLPHPHPHLRLHCRANHHLLALNPGRQRICYRHIDPPILHLHREFQHRHVVRGLHERCHSRRPKLRVLVRRHRHLRVAVVNPEFVVRVSDLDPNHGLGIDAGGVGSELFGDIEPVDFDGSESENGRSGLEPEVEDAASDGEEDEDEEEDAETPTATPPACEWAVILPLSGHGFVVGRRWHRRPPALKRRPTGGPAVSRRLLQWLPCLH